MSTTTLAAERAVSINWIMILMRTLGKQHSTENDDQNLLYSIVGFKGLKCFLVVLVLYFCSVFPAEVNINCSTFMYIYIRGQNSITILQKKQIWITVYILKIEQCFKNCRKLQHLLVQSKVPSQFPSFFSMNGWWLRSHFINHHKVAAALCSSDTAESYRDAT